jgi:hypothetical protein
MIKLINYLQIGIFFTVFSCESGGNNKRTETKGANSKIDTLKVYTLKSNRISEYEEFDSPKAVNRIAEIENEYFNRVVKSQSKYYGTVWQEKAKTIFEENDTISLFEKYKNLVAERNEKVDSMHCTIYALEALKAGMGEKFYIMDSLHKKIWKDREYAGWSVGHILTEKMGWAAYLIISKNSKEYENCIKNYKKDGKYHVWKQPDIRIEKMYNFDTEKVAINRLLEKHEYGWGFSEQGWHTWITRFKELKECNWLGAPSMKYALEGDKPLFLSTKFTKFYDYNSHIIIFPPKRNNSQN